MLFICPFARAAWFAEPWYIRSESLIHNTNSVADAIHSLIAMNHPHASLQNIFTFLWCLWKSRNDCLFNRKPGSPLQIHHAAQAISQAQELADEMTTGDSLTEVRVQQQQNSQDIPAPGNTIRADLLTADTRVYSDASWRGCNMP